MAYKSDFELYDELDKLNNELSSNVRQLRIEGVKFAEAERNYKIALRKEALKLRYTDKQPSQLVNLCVYGDTEDFNVANLRFTRDSQEAIYKSVQENINTIKLKIRIIDNQISREWGNTK